MKLQKLNPAKIGSRRRKGDLPDPVRPAAAAGIQVQAPTPGKLATADVVDLERRQSQLAARVAELQWDLGGLFYEMAVRNSIKLDVLIKHASTLQAADGELSEVERILRNEKTGVADSCSACGAPHSSGAVYCWQCGTALLDEIAPAAIGR